MASDSRFDDRVFDRLARTYVNERGRGDYADVKAEISTEPMDGRSPKPTALHCISTASLATRA